MVSSNAIYAAAKLKAHEANHKDAKKVLTELSKDPVENGAKIVKAMKAAENEGSFILLPCSKEKCTSRGTRSQEHLTSKSKLIQVNPS